MKLKLDKSVYDAEALAAGALALGTRARVFVDEGKLSFSVEVQPEALAGEFLNEALSHAYRQRVVAAHAPLTQAVLSPLLAKGFPAVPADPLEELEPQVKIDRTRDLDELLAKAREMR